MLAMALFFAACAGDDGNPGDPAEKPGQQVVDGYVKVAINMPTSSGLTRADDRYDDGESNEYKVNEALIAFFRRNRRGECHIPEGLSVGCVGLDGR